MKSSSYSTRGIGKIDTKTALAWNVSGPTLRATGMAHDVRKANPYCGFEQYDFEIPTQTTGDIYGRYLVRVEEMRQSVRIIEQALDKLPYGPVRDNNRKYVPPPRSEIGVSMEALMLEASAAHYVHNAQRYRGGLKSLG